MVRKILFLCTGNSARSQLAEGLFNRMAKGNFTAASAGTRPDEVDPRVVEVLTEHGIDASALRSKSTQEFEGQTFDFVITLCERAKDECGVFDEQGDQIHWDFADPRDATGKEAFEEVYRGLEERISLFLLLNGHQVEGVFAPTAFFKVMSDPLRLKIIMLLEDETVLSVSDLTEALGESQPKVSRHLALLRDSGFLQDERDGLWIFYRLSDHLPLWIKHTLQTVRNGNPGIINHEKHQLKLAERKRRYKGK
ncbi:metalloregulator ArsR/SmtB family transcription factor [Vibrio hannami]|uniref:metalloregulator ArsR/SmtB family transcription factor n=1 Tax=Vibrio hannami TaxID=2717094 RepID=UPI0024108AE6|nr:metalloregulator ArsR/SmtB family transcription factor [Vibrio hannami]MDG3087662.1 metalloregulator ArsR/SmtB family transcription factor [Vibrio hannami]